MKRIFSLITIITSLFLSSCLQDSLDDLTPISNDNNNNGTVTYNGSVKSILTQDCVSCHGSVNPSAGFDISTYNKAKNNINKIIDRIDLQTGQAGIMPPAGRMAESKINTIKDWLAQGLTE